MESTGNVCVMIISVDTIAPNVLPGGMVRSAPFGALPTRHVAAGAAARLPLARVCALVSLQETIALCVLRNGTARTVVCTAGRTRRARERVCVMRVGSVSVGVTSWGQIVGLVRRGGLVNTV